MENMKWKYVKPLKNQLAVRNFLKENHIHLPEELVKTISENNGGRPSKFLFDTDRRKEYVFQSLFSYNKEDTNSIYNIYFDIFENSDLYPIGMEAAGNIICYHLKEDKYVLWNHENQICEDIIMD